MTAIERKTSIGAVTIKSADQGEAVARFSNPDGRTPDKDREITGPDAFTEGAQAVVSDFGHRAITDGVLPAGRATIHRDGTADLKFFLDTFAGSETFATLKGLGSITQFSYAFTVLEDGEVTPAMRAAGAVRYLKRVEVLEVSPVVLGAGLNTGTLALKACGCHSGSTCGCPTKQPDRALLQVVADVKRRDAWIRCLKEPHGFEVWDIAECHFRWESNGLVQRGPIVRFVEADGKRAGYYDPLRPDEIFISRGLSRENALRVSAHEAAHAWACWDPSEASARLASKYTVQRYMRKFA